jgi:hypothetical protein
MKSIYKKEQGEKVYKSAYYKTLREWEVPYTSYFVMTRFGSTHVIEAGVEEAEVLVLLHGFAFSCNPSAPIGYGQHPLETFIKLVSSLSFCSTKRQRSQVGSFNANNLRYDVGFVLHCQSSMEER